MVKISFHCEASKRAFIKQNGFSDAEILKTDLGAIWIAEDTHNFINNAFVYAVTEC